MRCEEGKLRILNMSQKSALFTYTYSKTFPQKDTIYLFVYPYITFTAVGIIEL